LESGGNAGCPSQVRDSQPNGGFLSVVDALTVVMFESVVSLEKVCDGIVIYAKCI